MKNLRNDEWKKEVKEEEGISQEILNINVNTTLGLIIRLTH